MKPKRYFRSPLTFSSSIRYGAPVVLGFTILITGLAENSQAAIYGGPSSGVNPANPQPGSAPVGGTTPAATDAARAAALANLARTQQAVGAAKALQDAARAAAIAAPIQNAGPNPNIPGQTLPNVPNGLTPGGLQTAPGAAVNTPVWQGAELPTEAIANGLNTVTIRQTAQQALLNWQTFNVGKNTTVNFDQSAGGGNASQWIAFNKISDPTANPTQILGNINAQGQVYLINPNGIIFGGSSQINVHTLTASALPINDNLIARGLLNNPQGEFLFNGLGHNGKLGDVTVQAGAKITTPVSADGNGGRILLTGANVTNHGTLTTPSGQTILASGLQVGIAAHASTDPSRRGLDTYIGAVVDPASALAPYAGTTTNTGLIQATRGSITLTGKSLHQNGLIQATTSVSLNGRIDLLANYGAVFNPSFKASEPTTGTPFLYQTTGDVTFGQGSVTSILPETESTDKVVGSTLALRSQINVQAKTIHLETGSLIHAPNAIANFQAGIWDFAASINRSIFTNNSGQIYLDAGSTISLAGTVDAIASISQNLLTLELRGSELAPAPLQRDGELRGDTITVDLGQTGYYEGRFWVGTPLADLTGYVALVERTVAQLTTAGGTLNLSAGSSAFLQEGSTVDVSGGWTTFTGDQIATTKLIRNGSIIDISKATPDQIYSGVYTGTIDFVDAKWGVIKSYSLPLSAAGSYFKNGYTDGASGGTLAITSPAQALDGKLVGHTVAGENQIRNSGGTSSLPIAATLKLNFQADLPNAGSYITGFPTPPKITFQNGVEQIAVDEFATDASGNPLTLPADRLANVYLSPTEIAQSGFGHLNISNPEGSIVIPVGTNLDLGSGGILSLTSSNIDIFGNVSAAGGSLSFTALNISPYQTTIQSSSSTPATPPPNSGLGIVNLGAGATLSTAGKVIDDRNAATTTDATINGGTINISAYTANLTAGSAINVSGGYLHSAKGTGSYGNAGTINIKAGQDPIVTSVLGGQPNLASTLSGYTGGSAKAGNISILAPLIQIGGTTANANALLLDPQFFNQGGFGNFTLTGIGQSGQSAVSVAPGTVVEPVVKTQAAVITGSGVTLQDYAQTFGQPLPEGLRKPVSLTLAAPGVRDFFNSALINIGDVTVGENSVIRVTPGGVFSVAANTVSILGSVYAPGGTITVTGSSDSTPIFNDPNQARATTFLGSNSLLSTAGTTVLVPDLQSPFNRRIGQVLDGGNVTVSGNLVAAAGSVIDVSGTTSTLDIAFDGSGNIRNLPGATTTKPVQVDSSAGSITLRGGQFLFSDATLLGHAGGATANGGTLSVSSGRFYALGNNPLPTDINLVVNQSGLTLANNPANPIGQTIQGTNGTGKGYFTIDSFKNGGFDSLTLGGATQFSGPVDINARGKISLASRGILFADSSLTLNADYIAIGTEFAPPVLPEEETSPILFNGQPYLIPATFGAGNLSVSANLIDVGNLTLQGIGTANLTASNGDIRGNGTFTIAGDLTLTAGQIYPTTASKFTIAAYDYTSSGSAKKGSIKIRSSGTRQLPLSAGGTLGIYASTIVQQGTLRAPFGTINLGWDGSGTAPRDWLTGNSRPFPVTTNLTLSAGSVTSVSAVDPLTGKGIVVPYGISTDGSNWIDPRGIDITSGGLPEKTITLSGGNVSLAEGATIDLRGGGDLYADRFVAGLGGPIDILTSLTSFAILPGSDAGYAPYAAYNSSTNANNLINGASGYANTQLQAGDKIYLAASDKLPAGYYTLLPARYALLPGALLVTPRAGEGFNSVNLPEGSSIVSGTRYNSIGQTTAIPVLTTRFEIAPTNVVRARAQYDDFFANSFLKTRAAALNITTPLLPTDSGYLLFQATQSMELLGNVLSKSISGGRGASIDISSQLDTFIGNGPSNLPNTISLHAAALSAFEAESLLIGGRRTRTASGTTIEVRSGKITLDNAGTPLTAQDVILAAKDILTLAPGAEIFSTATFSAPAETFQITGNGALVRVSADPAASIIRSGTTTTSTSSLVIGANAKLTGGGLILDSSASLSLDPTADLLAKSHAFHSGKISLLLDNPGALPAGNGLILTTASLLDLQGSESLSLLSYSSIDIHGTGQIGGTALKSLSLNSGEIRGINQNGGNAIISAGNITLENTSNLAANATPTAHSGNLQLNAETIRLGANTTTINQYSNVTLNASRGIIGQGTGGLTTQNSLTVITPRLTGEAGAVRTITAGGTLSFNPSATPSTNVLTGGLGSTLSLNGTTIAVNTEVFLPSGALNIRAKTGDLTVGGKLDVSGTRQDFNDVIKTTSGGKISLAADTGNILLDSNSIINVAANSIGGNAGSLEISTPLGTANLNGTLLGKGGAGGTNGNFSLDTSTLGALTALSAALNNASLTQTQNIRVRNGSVLIDGLVNARDFTLSTDRGSITVTGKIDGSGKTGGSVRLSAHENLTLANGSIITVAAQDFDTAGKGGSITLEAGSQTNGIVGNGTLDLQTGSKLDLSVAANNSTSASLGKFTGKLHLRAPLTSTGTNLLLNPLNATITGASSILAEGYKLYDRTDVASTINAALQTQIKTDGETFLGVAGSSAKSTALTNQILANNQGLASVFVLAPGAEIIHRTGSLNLGTAGSTSAADWNLSGFRFGEKSAAGVLTIRAAGNLTFNNALSDGFTSAAYNATLLNQNPLLPVNTQSWSFNLVAGADLGASDYARVTPLSNLAAGTGSVLVGKNNGTNGTDSNSGNNASTATALTDRFQVIRTGTGDIDIHAGRSLQLLNHFSTIYTAGTKVLDASLGVNFDLPILNQTGGSATLGADQQSPPYAVQYSFAGGDVSITAGQDIEHITRNNLNQIIADSQRQLPNNWLYRRGYVDPATGLFAASRWGDISSTTWWIDFSNFFQGIGALGGGNVSLTAGNDINNVDAVIPTNARMPKGTPNLSSLIELGGGDLTVRASNNLNAGVYYVERGHGELTAGGDIVTNATRSPSLYGLTSSVQAPLDSATWLPTTLFLGKGGFDVTATGDVLLGPVGNPFLLPPGINNTYWQKSYFSTYAADSYVNVSSYSGDVTLRESATLAGTTTTPLLLAWVQNQHLFTTNPASASFYQPWLRLAENNTDPFRTVVSLLPGTLRATSFSSDINLVGNLTLSPSATGTLDLLAKDAINGLQRNGSILLLGTNTSTWGASRINVSDADPAAIPGIANPYGYRAIAGNSQSLARVTQQNFLSFVDRLFLESGGTLGNQAVLETKQALHAAGILHRNDTTPLHLYAGTGDISGITLFSPKAAQIIAGRDIADIAFYIQNVRATDTSIVSSGRDLIPYSSSSPLRISAGQIRNTINSDSIPLAGDLQISGPGALQVLAGRNLDLGNGPNNPDGTGTGLTSIGNTRNPSLPFAGANLVVGAGLDASASLFNNPNLNWSGFIEKYVTTEQGKSYLTEIDPALIFELQSPEEQARLALEIFYLILRDAGRNYSSTGNYTAAYEAIETLFGENYAGTGDILTRARDIRTTNGGSIDIITPGGGLALADSTFGNPLSPPGIITESGGSISIFAKNDISIGIGRIFTLRGGDEILWSTDGNIAAGSSSKTVQSAPPTRVLIDPQSASVQTDLSGLATGGGIGVLATVAGIKPGNVDLIAPNGFVDAGDAGIRVTGNLNIAASQVLNAGNISAGGVSTGAPTVSSVSPNVSVSTASNAAAAATNSTTQPPTNEAPKEEIKTEDTLSIISVEVIGYGGATEDLDDDEEERRKKQIQEQQQQPR